MAKKGFISSKLKADPENKALPVRPAPTVMKTKTNSNTSKNKKGEGKGKKS